MKLLRFEKIHPSETLKSIMRPFHETAERLRFFIEVQKVREDDKAQQISEHVAASNERLKELTVERDSHAQAQIDAKEHLTAIEGMLGVAVKQAA